MKRKSACCLILFFFVAVLLGCGDSDDEDVSQPTTQTTTQTQTPSPDEVAEVQPQEVDFPAEEEAIRQLFQSHAAATMKRDVELIIEHWIDKKNDRDVFMMQCFLGINTPIEKLEGVKRSFEGDFKLGRSGMTVTIEKVGIDKRGEKATIRGTYKWAPAADGQYVAAIEKDKNGDWKIRAIDFCDRKFIKEIKPIE